MTQAAADQVLPEYDGQLSDFHRAFQCELEDIVNALPLEPGMRVLDAACGNGFYTRRIADRLGRSGSVTGVDANVAYVSQARKEAGKKNGRAAIEVVKASFDAMPFEDDSFDLVWCAQSLQSLPEPRRVLAQLSRVLRPGGVMAVLENDTMHQVVLPWPVTLELPLREAELLAITAGTRFPSKYYVGRSLLNVMAAAGLTPMTVATHAIDRTAPFGPAEESLLQGYLEQVEGRVAPYLEASLLRELRLLVDPASPRHLLRQRYLTMTWLNVLALGRKQPSAETTGQHPASGAR